MLLAKSIPGPSYADYPIDMDGGYGRLGVWEGSGGSRGSFSETMDCTYIVQPIQFAPLRIRLDMALEVHILPILDVLGR